MKSDCEDLMPRLLPVDPQNQHAASNDDGPPRNPQEYLRQVQLEAALCPEVVVAQIDPKKLRKKQSVNASVSGCPQAPVGFCPGLGWQRQQVSNFSTVRQNISKHRAHWSSHTLDDNVLLPQLTDEEGWKRFCLGENVYLSDPTRPQPDPTTAQPDPTRPQPDPTTPQPDCTALDYSKVGFPPFLSIISRLNQSTVSTVLEILIMWFEDRDFSPQLGRWLYGLLACLEKPLLPECHSLIRQLARRCGLLRTTLESQQDDRLPALNLLICLVARYFEQSDLADQEE